MTHLRVTGWKAAGIGALLLAGTSACTSESSADRSVTNNSAAAASADLTATDAPANLTNTAAAPRQNLDSPAPPQAMPEDLPASNDMAEVKPFPKEVTDFMVTRDSCDHFRGEEAYNDDRRAYLEENVRELCTGTDDKLAALRKRHAGEPDVIAALSGYEDRIEMPPGS